MIQNLVYNEMIVGGGTSWLLHHTRPAFAGGLPILGILKISSHTANFALGPSILINKDLFLLHFHLELFSLNLIGQLLSLKRRLLAAHQLILPSIRPPDCTEFIALLLCFLNW